MPSSLKHRLVTLHVYREFGTSELYLAKAKQWARFAVGTVGVTSWILGYELVEKNACFPSDAAVIHTTEDRLLTVAQLQQLTKENQHEEP